MTLTIITSHESAGKPAETRYHLDSMAAMHALVGVPEWVRQRPFEGGEHNVTTCERCANAARLRALFANADVRECDVMRREDKEQSQSQRDAYAADRDHRRVVMRKCLTYVRIAENTPVRKLPQAIRELRVIAATHKLHMELGHGTQARTLYMWAVAAADVAWERYRLAYHAS